TATCGTVRAIPHRPTGRPGIGLPADLASAWRRIASRPRRAYAGAAMNPRLASLLRRPAGLDLGPAPLPAAPALGLPWPGALPAPPRGPGADPALRVCRRLALAGHGLVGGLGGGAGRVAAAASLPGHRVRPHAGHGHGAFAGAGARAIARRFRRGDHGLHARLGAAAAHLGWRADCGDREGTRLNSPP